MSDSSNGNSIFSPKGKEAVDKLIRENSHIFTEGQCKVCNAVLISESQKLAHYQSKKHANKYRRYQSLQSYPKMEDDTPVTKKVKANVNESSNGEVDRNKCCPLCNMKFSSPVVAQSHYQGKIHSKNLKLKYSDSPVGEGMIQAKNARVAYSAPVAPPRNEYLALCRDPDKFCSLCNATFNNPVMAQQHYAGKKHKKQENKQKLMEHYGQPPAQETQQNMKKPVAESSQKPVKGYPCEPCNIVLNSVEQYQAHISGAKHQNQIRSGTQAAYEEPHRYQYMQEERISGGYSRFSQDL